MLNFILNLIDLLLNVLNLSPQVKVALAIASFTIKNHLDFKKIDKKKLASWKMNWYIISLWFDVNFVETHPKPKYKIPPYAVVRIIERPKNIKSNGIEIKNLN